MAEAAQRIARLALGTSTENVHTDPYSQMTDAEYRTSPLNGLSTHMKSGFYHDGRFATLADVLNHYDSCMSLGLSPGEKSDIVEYLKSLPNTAQTGIQSANDDN